MSEDVSGRISKLEATTDTLTSRGGLAFFVKYVETVGIMGLLLSKFEGIKKSAKGVSLKNLFLQTLSFFFDGTSRHVNYFDQLKNNTGYTAVIEIHARQMASSHAMKRFYGAFRDLCGCGFSLGFERIVYLAVEIGGAASGGADAGYDGDG